MDVENRCEPILLLSYVKRSTVWLSWYSVSVCWALLFKIMSGALDFFYSQLPYVMSYSSRVSSSRFSKLSASLSMELQLLDDADGALQLAFLDIWVLWTKLFGNWYIWARFSSKSLGSEHRAFFLFVFVVLHSFLTMLAVGTILCLTVTFSAPLAADNNFCLPNMSSWHLILKFINGEANDLFFSPKCRADPGST